MAVLLSLSFILTGCQPEADDDDGGGGNKDETQLSDNADLATGSATVVKGEVVTFDSEDADHTGAFDKAVSGSVTIGTTAAQTAGLPTSFTPADAKATVKVVKVAGTAAGNYAETDFGSANAYNDGAIGNEDVFFVRVTAENGAVKWYRITVTVEASSDATLKRVVVKDVVVPVTAFTTGDGVAIGTAKAATVTVKTAPAADTMKETAFEKNDLGATVKVVKKATGVAGDYTGADIDTDGVQYNGTDPVANGDVFFVKVTAEDETAVWYKVTVTVSNVAVTVAGGPVSGNLNAAITAVDLTLTITNAPDVKFQSVPAGTVVTTWFTGLPAGLAATVESVDNSGSELTITISGIPAVAVDPAAAVAIQIPDGKLATITGSIDVTGTVTVSVPAPSAMVTGDVTITGTAGAELATGQTLTITLSYDTFKEL